MLYAISIFKELQSGNYVEIHDKYAKDLVSAVDMMNRITEKIIKQYSAYKCKVSKRKTKTIIEVTGVPFDGYNYYTYQITLEIHKITADDEKGDDIHGC